MDIKPAVPSALPSSWTIPQTVNMNDHGRKLSWTAQLSPYLRSLKMKKNIMPSPKPKSPKSPKSPKNSREEDSDFQIIHTPDRPERPISRTAIPTDEQCMEFLMSLQRQEENRRGGVKSGLKMWPYSQEDEPEDRRYLRSVRVESVQFEEARLARTNSSGPARMVEVGRSSTKSTLATPRVSDAEEEEEEEDDDDDADNESIVEPKRCLHAALSPPPTLHLSQTYLDIHTPRANTSRWSDDSIESRLSSREHDSPCVQRCQRATLRSSAEALSSPTVFGDDSMEPSTPPLLTPVKVRPATPFTDPHLGAVTDPTTPPPSDQVAHLMHVSPAPVPRKYSWRSSRDTILNAEAPVSKLPSWLPEPRLREEDKKQQQGGEPEVYGDWADYYFEDGNFWDDYSDGGSEEDETRVETEIDADEQDEAGTEKEDQEEEKKEDQKDRRQADEGVYPRYESFIEDYKKNVMSVTIKEV